MECFGNFQAWNIEYSLSEQRILLLYKNGQILAMNSHKVSQWREELSYQKCHLESWQFVVLISFIPY